MLEINKDLPAYRWGINGDRPILGDFDGDGKTDISAYRPATGEWFLRRSSSSYTFGITNSYFQWGAPNDIQLPR